MLSLDAKNEQLDALVAMLRIRYEMREPPYRTVDVVQVLDAIARALPIRRLYLFGSYARGEQRVESDIDAFIVPLPGFSYSDGTMFRDAVEDIFGLDVDVLTSLNGCRMSFVHALKAEAVLVYDKK